MTIVMKGRYIQFDYPKLSVISLYLPSGTSGDERQAVKYDFRAICETFNAIKR